MQAEEQEVSEVEIEQLEDDEALLEQQVIPENTDHIPADDTVSLYFRQMASEPLLTAEQEVMLAKRIELGTKATEEMSQNRKSLDNDRLADLKVMVKDAQAAREHL